MSASPVECRQIAAHSLLLEACGRVTRVSMLTQLETFKTLLTRMREATWIIDTSGLDDFEPGAVGVGADYFRAFKAAGGTKVVFVSGLATARLAAFTIAFAAHLPLVPAQSLAEAYEMLGIGPAPSRHGAPDSRSSGTRVKL
jgi:hypothetical protein